jgi:hypothetical protein
VALAAAVLLAVLLTTQARADDRSLAVLFGPASEEAGQVAAHSVAGTAHDWLKIDGASVELRRAGVEGQELTKYMQPKDLEQAFLDGARGGRQTDMLGFLNALDKAGYALARRHGKRLLIAVLESPPAGVVAAMKGGPEEVENRINQTVDFCRSNSVNVIVLDPSAPASKEPLAALKTLAGATGGALVRDPKALDSSVLVVAPVETAVSANAPSSPPAAAAPSGLPVRARLFRTQPRRANDVHTDLGPMDGFLLVECPLNALEFRVDDRGGKFLVHARVSQIIRNAEGKTVWQSKKEITLKEPVKKMPSRRAGNLYYMRQLQLPAGQYTIEAAVEDLVAGKSGTISQPVRATDSVPGLDVSDAMFVRPLNEAGDRFEADQVLSYDGKALAPMLDPVFLADEPFELRLYFVIYPDMRGAKPEISIEILRNGQAVGRSQLAFNDEIRNTATEDGTMGSKGEQKHEFPYLSDMRDATFDAGQYEARVTIQGRNTVTRVAPFRVIGAQVGK